MIVNPRCYVSASLNHISADLNQFMVRDDSNLLYSDISRGDELKPN
jgi:hypothetical protein